MGALNSIFFTLIVSFSCFAFAQEEEVIPWSVDRKLKWSDFKGSYFKNLLFKDIETAYHKMEKSIKKATGLSVKIESI